MIRRALDRILVWIADTILLGFFRSVEVTGRDRIPSDRPVIVVSNHFNGLVDPMILVRVLGRMPRFLAAAKLWRLVPARPFLALVGLIPVYRPEDEGQAARNRSAFEASHEALARGGTVALFPEGHTHDEPSLMRVRTGAARIALGAVAAGARELAIVPIGLTFDDKLALRSRALARVGRPIDLDAEMGRFVEAGEAVDESNHQGVRRLTDAVEACLRSVTPEYDSLMEQGALARAADVALRPGVRSYRQGVPLADRERLAERLSRAPDGARREVLDALGRYALDLQVTRLRDDQLVPGYTRGQLLLQFLVTTALVVVLFPVALAGLVLNVVPYALVRWAGSQARAPVSKGSRRILVALVAFPVTWLLFALFSQQVPGSGWWIFLEAPAFGLVTLFVLERSVGLVSAWRGWRAMYDRRALIPDVMVERARFVEAVKAALAEPSGAAVSGGG